MNKAKRTSGRLIREIVRLDRSWKAGGKQEGRVENRLCWRMGIAIRAGVSATQIDRARRRANG